MSRLEFRKQTSRRQVTFGLCINLAKKIQRQEVNMTASHLWCLEARRCHLPSKSEKRDSRHQKSTRGQVAPYHGQLTFQELGMRSSVHPDVYSASIPNRTSNTT
ncbi:hypothetical protein PIB30_098396, partial [Stylosanthes scabra]|nr:hypothetical protein [Stylosanthes scabra]